MLSPYGFSRARARPIRVAKECVDGVYVDSLGVVGEHVILPGPLHRFPLGFHPFAKERLGGVECATEERNRPTALARALEASTSRSRGGAFVTRESRSSRAAVVT